MAQANANLMGMTMRGLAAVTADEATCRQWLHANRLLAATQVCQCGQVMVESGYTRSIDDQLIWRCRGCRLMKNLRKGSFFERSKLTLTQLTDLTYWWAHEAHNFETEFQVGVDTKTVIDWYSFLRDVCSADLLANPQQIGGNGHVVAIDESVVARRKPGNAQGRAVREQWVFGGVDLTTKQFFIELVPRRDAATLLPIIQRNIVAGTMIWSDEWAALYNNLPAAGYPHQTVNHTILYVDPVTGCHTNDIESRWNACKSTFKAKHGVPRLSLPSYLDAYMWRCRRDRSAYFHDIVQAIARQYPV